MENCLKQFAQKGKREEVPGNGIMDKPETRYIHRCKQAKISVLLTQKTERSKFGRVSALNKVCKTHCNKCK